MNDEQAAKLRAVGALDQSDAVVRRIMDIWDVEPYLANALTSLSFHLGRAPTDEESECVIDWTLETLVRAKLQEGFMQGKWFLTGVTRDSSGLHPLFGEFKAGGGQREGPG